MTQTGKVVLHNLIESMRAQDIVDVGEHVVDVVVPEVLQLSIAVKNR